MYSDKIALYAKKYRKMQSILILVLTIIFSIIGLLFVGVGLFLCCDTEEIAIIFISVIIIVAGVLNFLLAIKFRNFSINKLKKLNDNEAAKKYTKIMGIE